MQSEAQQPDESGWVPLRDRGVLAVEGPEARSFLQGLISNDLARLSEKQSIYAALLTPQGKFLFELILYQKGERILVETERDRLPLLNQRLMLYRLRARVEIIDLGEELRVAGLLAADLPARLGLPPEAGACRALGDGSVVAIDPRLADLGGRALLPSTAPEARLEQAFGLRTLPAEAYERRRLVLGVPDGSRDMVIERATLLESGFEELHGVDFKKGCFVGQELTARMKYRGLVRKRLLPVRIDGAAPEPGTPIRAGGKDAGEMRTSLGDRGLALIRLEPAAAALRDSTPLLAGDARVTPETPTWADVTLSPG